MGLRQPQPFVLGVYIIHQEHNEQRKGREEWELPPFPSSTQALLNLHRYVYLVM